MFNERDLEKLKKIDALNGAKRMEVKKLSKRGETMRELTIEYNDGRMLKSNLDQNIMELFPVSGMTTISSHFARGKYGNPSYRGNCTGLIIKEVLEFFKPKRVMDLMEGSGTAKEVCKELDIPIYSTDLRYGNDILKDVPPHRSDFIWLHPPYYVPKGSYMPKYSGVQWGSESHESDGSHLESFDSFMNWFNQVQAKAYENLVKGGRLAILMGDTRFKGKLYSMMKSMDIYGELEHIIIKEQHNNWSDDKKYAGKYIPIMHEYLIIIKKPDVFEIPVSKVKNARTDFRKSMKISWKNLIAKYIEYNGGSMTRKELLSEIKNHPKSQANNHLEAKIRQVVNSFKQVFATYGEKVKLQSLTN